MFVAALMAGVGLIGDPQVASAQISTPGSLIVFPKFHTGFVPATTTAQTTFEIGVVCPNNVGQVNPSCFLGQAVTIRLLWICPPTAQNAAGVCQSQGFTLHTTVNGKLEFDAAGRVTVGPFDLNGGVIPTPACAAGYLIAFVVDNAGVPISFNGLIGEEVFRQRATSASGYNGITFRSSLPTGTPTDANHNGALDFDGIEYQKTYSRFAADVRYEKASSPPTQTVLTVLTLDLRQNASNPNVVAPLTFYRANEVPLAETIRFTCWRELRLTDIDPVLTQVRQGTKGVVATTSSATVSVPCADPGCAPAGTPMTTIGVVTTLEDAGSPREYGYQAYGLGSLEDALFQ